ncbi:MAG: hypothetical protein WCC21_06150 [Candidatus Acidiferrales bacterium]
MTLLVEMSGGLVDEAGGATIGLVVSKEDMEVIDLGVSLLSMRSPPEISSKADVWISCRTMSAFYGQ